MTLDFFEGPAGTGKTFNLVKMAEELVGAGFLGDGQKVLALSFANGARRRLEARLAEKAILRSRFACMTFDVFARTVAARQHRLLTPSHISKAEALGEFDGPCCQAGSLLEYQDVRQWVARAYPLVLVDEAQDLDEHRFAILKLLAQDCRTIVAADAFQCLRDKRDTSHIFEWLEGVGQIHRLTRSERCKQEGLLGAALAVKEGRDIKSVLSAQTFKSRTGWYGPGIALAEAPATKNNPAVAAWAIANAMSKRTGQFAIITPDSKSSIVRGVLDLVAQRRWPRNGSTFGPYRFNWERDDNQEAAAILAEIEVPEAGTYTSWCDVLAPIGHHAAVANTLQRIDRLRRVQGQRDFTGVEVRTLVAEAVRNQSRLGLRERRGHVVLTMDRAKNQEYPNVIVIWPRSATGTDEHLRRLLYNGMTRAQNHCSVVVFGTKRLGEPPFAPRVEQAS